MPANSRSRLIAKAASSFPSSVYTCDNKSSVLFFNCSAACATSINDGAISSIELRSSLAAGLVLSNDKYNAENCSLVVILESPNSAIPLVTEACIIVSFCQSDMKLSLKNCVLSRNTSRPPAKSIRASDTSKPATPIAGIVLPIDLNAKSTFV